MGFCLIIQRTEGSREAARNVYGGRCVYTVDSDVLIGVSRIGEEYEWSGSLFTQNIM